MSTPSPLRATEATSSTTRLTPPQRPEPTALQPPQDNVNDTNTTSTPNPGQDKNNSKKKKRNNHRGGKKKRTRRQSFAASIEDGNDMGEMSTAQRIAQSQNTRGSSFYRGRNLSTTSIESEELLDHRLVFQCHMRYCID